MKQHKQYFPALTGIRAMAAYAVFIFHFNPFRDFENEPATIGQALFRFCNELHVGVTVFFVLSGFLITLRYQKTAQLTKKWLLKYTLNRFSRLFPMYAFVLSITLLVIALRIDYSYLKEHVTFPPANKFIILISNFTLTKGFFNDLKFSGISQAWSLTPEECFYFTAPFVLVSRLSIPNKLGLYVAASLATGLLLTGIGDHITWYGFFSSLDFLFSFTFFGRCLEFASGMALAYLLNSDHPFSFRHFTLAGAAGIVFFTALLIFYPKTTWQGLIINNCLLPFAICSLFLGLIREHTQLSQLLKTSLFDLLGKSSYTFYLIHAGIIQLFIIKYVSQNKLACFLLLNVLAIILFKLVEEPCHRALKKLGGLPNAATTPAISARPIGQE